MGSFIGQITMFGGNYAPVYWAQCDGQLLSPSQNQALFSLLGTYYGGNGSTSYGLPDLRGRIPVDDGSGPGLTPRYLGSRFGQESVALTTAQIPPHQHLMQGTTADADRISPQAGVLATTTAGFYTTTPSDPLKFVEFEAGVVGDSGAGVAHSNMMPSLCLNFIICMTGDYPSRN